MAFEVRQRAFSSDSIDSATFAVNPGRSTRLSPLQTLESPQYRASSGLASAAPTSLPAAAPLPLANGGRSLAAATNLSTVFGQRSWDGAIGGNNPLNLYRFQLDATSNLRLDVVGLTENADLWFIRDTNNNGQWDSGDTIATSQQIGALPEHLDLNGLASGTYYVAVESAATRLTSYTLRLTADAAGDTLSTARAIGPLSGTQIYRDFVDGSVDRRDLYSFSLAGPRNLTITLDGLSNDVDLYLIRDANNNGAIDANESLAVADLPNADFERIQMNRLAAGNYFLVVGQYRGESNYTLTFETHLVGDRPVQAGTLGADTFSVNLSSPDSVISGNGNLDFGRGQYDRIDLSSLLSSSVQLNLASVRTGGVVYDPGNGARRFDALTLSNGTEILFEGIDLLQFSDRTLTLAITPNDPLFNQQWNLGMMGLPDVWRFTTGSPAVLIGIEDSGLAYTANGQLPLDLRPTLTQPSNAADDFEDRDISHGTAVASIIAAASNNGIGMTGINWNSPVYSIDVLGDTATDVDLAAATQTLINEASRNQQQLVINLSLGYRNSFSGANLEPDFTQIVANNPNVLFVIAAGNNGNQGQAGLSYPATLAQQYRNVIAVGAAWGRTDRDGITRVPGERIQYSWWGSQYGNGLTLLAPSEVVATQADWSTQGPQFSYFTGNGDRFNGTSAAAPNVTGVASLVWSVNPTLTATQVSDILVATAIDLGAPGYDRFYGNGFINADAAVRRAIAMILG